MPGGIGGIVCNASPSSSSSPGIYPGVSTGVGAHGNAGEDPGVSTGAGAMGAMGAMGKPGPGLLRALFIISSGKYPGVATGTGAQEKPGTATSGAGEGGPPIMDFGKTVIFNFWPASQ